MNSIDVAKIKKVKLTVEIWADIVCPWCYIGKRRFEVALAQFEHKQDVDIEWKSYQLNPNSKPDPNKSIHESLAEKKGWTLEYTKQMHDHIASLASELGLIYNFDKVIPANTFDAHRLLQLAKRSGIGPEAEELLFESYFTYGKNISDHSTLLGLGIELGLNKKIVSQMLASNQGEDDISRDLYEAQQLGIRGVPFFLTSEKYAISGAQPSETFLNMLRKAWISF